eukprot:Colp12_sorted_trinity150504_noHs@27808
MPSQDWEPLLTQRIAKLEELLAQTETTSKSPLHASLDKIHQKISHIVAKGGHIKKLLEKADEVDRLSSAKLLEETTLTSDAKTEIILASGEQLRRTAELLEHMNDFQRFINTDSFKEAAALAPELQRLHQVHAEQEAQSQVASARVTRLLAAYDSLITTVSLKFVEWEDILAQLEGMEK